MMRERPCDEPRSWGMSYCSSPSTRTPRRARCATVALPIPPTPTTMTSYAPMGRSSLCHPEGRLLYLAHGRAIAIDHQDALGQRRLRFRHVDIRGTQGTMGKGQLRHPARLDPELYPFPTQN